MTKNDLSVISLFSGAGGFDHGFHQAGFETILASELLETGSNTLATYFAMDIEKAPAVPHYNDKNMVVQGDIRDVDFSDYNFQPDVVIGGPPCQDFSRIRGGNEQGLNGGRGKLYAEFVRALMFLQPKFFVFENVPGLVSANDGEAYDFIRKDFQDLASIQKSEIEKAERKIPDNEIQSYHLLFNSIVYAPNIGVPQKRKRLIIIGIRNDLATSLKGEELNQLKEKFAVSLDGTNSLFKKFPLTVLEVFEGKPLNELDEVYKEVMREYEEITQLEEIPAVEGWVKKTWNKLTFDIVADYYLASGLDFETDHDEPEFSAAMDAHRNILKELGWLNIPVHSIDNETDLRTSHQVKERMRHIPPGENYKFTDNTEWEVAGHNISLIYRRADPLKPAWTVVAYGGGGTYGYHYKRSRAPLTLRERARIQTFPDNLKFSGKKTEIRAQIGEAVPPLLGKIIAKEIKSILDELKIISPLD